MAQWLTTRDVVPGDTVRFSDTVFRKTLSRTDCCERVVTAKVLAIEGAKTRMKVVYARGDPPLAAGDTITRRTNLLVRARLERMRWDREDRRRQAESRS